MRIKLLILVFTCVAIFGVTLQWDANPPEDNVAQYKVYDRDTNILASVTNTAASVTTISGSNYFFSVTAVGQNGIESLHSDTLNYTEPVTAIIVSPQITNSSWATYNKGWSVSIKWATVANATGYLVTLDNGTSKLYSTTTNHTYSTGPGSIAFVPWTVYVQTLFVGATSAPDSFVSSPRIPATPTNLRVN